MVYSGLLLYTLLDQNENAETIVFPLRCLSIYAMQYRFTEDQDTVADAVKQHVASEHVLDHIGREKIVLRIKKTLSSPKALDYKALQICLLNLWALACSPAMQPLLLQHGIFENVNQAVKLQFGITAGAEERLGIWALSLDILRCTTLLSARIYDLTIYL